MLSSTNESQRLPVSLAISHSHGYAFCALCQELDGEVNSSALPEHPEVRPATVGPSSHVLQLGCDIEWIEHRDQSFVNDFFTAQEIRDVMGTPVEHRDCPCHCHLECQGVSAQLLLRTGLRVDTRRIECRFEPINRNGHRSR